MAAQRRIAFDAAVLIALSVPLGGCGEDQAATDTDASSGSGTGDAGVGGSGGSLPELPFSGLYGDAQDQRATAVAADAAGNVVVAGAFQGTIDLGGGPLQSAAEGSSLFVAIRDVAGSLLWSRQYGGGGGWATPRFAALDAEGSTYLVGDYGGAFDFGFGPSPDFDPVDESVFALRLDPSGNLLWVRTYADLDFDSGGASGLAIAASGRIAVAYSVVDGCVTGGGELDGFVHMLDEGGNELWQKRFGKDTECGNDFDEWVDEWIAGVAFDAGGSLAIALGPEPELAVVNADTGNGQPVALDPAVGESVGRLFGGAAGELYAWTFQGEARRVVRIGPDGAAAWSADLPGEPSALAASSSGVLVAGRAVSSSAWVLRVGADGAQAWSRDLAGDIEPNGVAWALDGHPVVVGGCRGTVDLGDGAKTAQGQDAFVADLAP